jgi:dolichyl-phosphate beta-glucosyltransferase
MKKLSVVIPMFNELDAAPKTAVELSSYLEEHLGNDFEILFSDDGSTDDCAKAVASLKLPNVRVIRYAVNKGKGSAIREGIMRSNGDIVVYTDSDLAYGAEAVYNIYKELENSGANVVIGSRNLKNDGYEGYTLTRKLMSKAYIKLISAFAGFGYSDSQCGIKAFTAESAKTIFSRCKVNGFAFDLEALILADKLKMSVKELPVKIINHRESQSKVNPVKDALKMVSDVNRIKKTHKYFSGDVN